ncbi:MAG: hypothetical protein K2Q09_01345 [Phycisphaerales bacterium]|nr:hypothetical protein [Phycisphaerales bacterium]
MGTAETPPMQADADPLAVFKGNVRTAVHDAKNTVGLMWIHLAALERRLGATPDPEAKEAVDALKEETRQIVRLLEALSEQARR